MSKECEIYNNMYYKSWSSCRYSNKPIYGIHRLDLLDAIQEAGYDRETAEKIIDKMVRKGYIRPSKGNKSNYIILKQLYLFDI